MEEIGTPQVNVPTDYRDISIWLDKYEDLFSDFDSSHFKARTLSDTFLSEIHKLVHEVKSDNVELKFNLMLDQPDAEIESVITNNIHNYFAAKAERAKNEMTTMLRNGALLAGGGFLLIIFLITLGHTWNTLLVLKGFEMMLEPLGWFLVWNGLDMIFVQAKKEQPAIAFNKKMTNAKLTFISFGMPVMMDEIPQTHEELQLAS